MRQIPKCLVIACSSALLASAMAGCGSSETKSSANNNASESPPIPSTPTTAAATTAGAGTVLTTEAEASQPAGASAPAPTADPCDLLTTAVATQALGVPVGEKISQPGTGNQTCSYRPADPGLQGIVMLTLYGITGSVAALDSAALQFPDAEPVEGVGDAARVSVQYQSIGVLTGSTIFALSLFPQQPDGTLDPVSKAQLVAAAQAVIDGQ